MPTPNENLTRWTVSVSKSTDIALRSFLAQRGMKKGDMSKFIEESVKWRVFDETVEEIRNGFADMSDKERQSLVSEATEAVRQEMMAEFARQNKC